MPPSPCHIGERRAGYTRRTREDGFSGIAGTIAAEDVLMIRGKSGGGKHFLGMSDKLRLIVNQETCRADGASVKHCFIGRTTAESYRRALPAGTVDSGKSAVLCKAGMDAVRISGT